jgi:nitroreductase
VKRALKVDVLDAIRNRRAVRDYVDEPLDRRLIEAVIADAVWAPSGMNRQPWRFFVIEGREALARYSAEAKSLMLAQAERRPEIAAVRGMLEQQDFNIFYNAPALIVICATEADEMAVKDCSLAAQTLMLAACARGLGTCWIGFAEAWLNSPAAKAELGIPEVLRPVAPILIGRPKAASAPPARDAPEVSYVRVEKT